MTHRLAMTTFIVGLFWATSSQATFWQEYLVCKHHHSRTVIDEAVAPSSEGSFKAVYQLVIRDQRLVDYLWHAGTTFRANDRGEIIWRFADPDRRELTALGLSGVVSHPDFPADDYFIEVDYTNLPETTVTIHRTFAPGYTEREYLGEYTLFGCELKGSQCWDYSGSEAQCVALSSCSYDTESQRCLGPLRDDFLP